MKMIATTNDREAKKRVYFRKHFLTILRDLPSMSPSMSPCHRPCNLRLAVTPSERERERERERESFIRNNSQ